MTYLISPEQNGLSRSAPVRHYLILCPDYPWQTNDQLNRNLTGHHDGLKSVWQCAGDYGEPEFQGMVSEDGK